MTGILFLGVVILWIGIAIALARAMTRNVTPGVKRTVAGVLVFALLLPLPVADEIVGGFQLRTLCREGAVARYDEERLRGRTVRMRLEPNPGAPSVLQTPTRRVPALIPIEEQTEEWIDVSTGEVLLSQKAYSARGGLLIRTLGISNSDSPLTIDPRWCAINAGPLFQRLGVREGQLK